MGTGADLRAVQTFAAAAQRAGLSGLVVTEGSRTAYLTVAAAALAADQLHLSTGVAVAFPRSPMVTAQSAWELAEATGGRFRLGLGTQVRIHAERRYGVPFDPPGPRLREYVQAVKAIFRAFRGEEKLDFSGTYWSFSFMPAAWSPGPISVPDPPVDVAAVNPWMWRMAGQVADGVHVHPLHSTSYLDEVARPALREGAAERGTRRPPLRADRPHPGDRGRHRGGAGRHGEAGARPARLLRGDAGLCLPVRPPGPRRPGRPAQRPPEAGRPRGSGPSC